MTSLAWYDLVSDLDPMEPMHWWKLRTEKEIHKYLEPWLSELHAMFDCSSLLCSFVQLPKECWETPWFDMEHDLDPVRRVG